MLHIHNHANTTYMIVHYKHWESHWKPYLMSIYKFKFIGRISYLKTSQHKMQWWHDGY